MDWIQAFTIIGVLGGFIFWMINRVDSDIKSVREDFQGWSKHLTAMQAEQSKRTDRLYEMWVETQKEIKQLYIDRK